MSGLDSVCEVTYSDKAPPVGGAAGRVGVAGLMPQPCDNGPDTRDLGRSGGGKRRGTGRGSAKKGGRPLKGTLLLLIKRPVIGQ